MAISGEWWNTVSGAPVLNAQQLRQLDAALYSNGTANRWGGVAGPVAGRGGDLAVTSTTWTVNPGVFVVYPLFALSQGPYRVLLDATQTGAMNAANGTNPRYDILQIRIDDTDMTDGSGARAPVITYKAGTAAGTPLVPAADARCTAIGTIYVPASGGGSPSVTATPPVVLNGGVQPVASSAAYPAAPYAGMTVFDQSLKQIGVSSAGSAIDQFYAPATGRRVDGTGTVTVGTTPVPVTSFSSGSSYIVGDITYGSGIFTAGSAGVYRWDATVLWPSASASYRVSQYVLLNGTQQAAGIQSMQFASGYGSQWLTSGYTVKLVAGDTLQLTLVGSTAGITGVVPLSFALTRTG